MAAYKCVAVDENNRPQASVNIYAVSLNNYPTISDVVQADLAGEAFFTGLVGPHFFWAQEIRTSATVGERVYTGRLHVQVVSFGQGPCYDYVVDANGMGTHTTVSAAVEAHDASSGPHVIFICPGSYAETISYDRTGTTHQLTIIGAGRDSVIIKPGAGSSGTLFDVTAQSDLILQHLTLDASSMNAGSHVLGEGNGNGYRFLEDVHIITVASGGGIIYSTAAGDYTRMLFCHFSGAGTALLGNSNPGVLRTVAEFCWFKSTLAAAGNMLNFSDMQILNCRIDCAQGFTFDSSTGYSNSGEVTVMGCRFNCSTNALKFGVGSSGLRRATVTGNRFSGSTIAIDITGGSFAVTIVNITGNEFLADAAGEIGVKLQATIPTNSAIVSNTFTGYTAGNEVSGQTLAQLIANNVQVAHNATDSGTAIVDSGLGHAGVGATAAHNILDGGTAHLDSLAGTVVLGDLIHGNATPKWARLAGNTTTTKKFLTQTGAGAASAVPGWNTIADADVPGTHSGSAHHDPVTLAADADTILGLSTQQLTLDTQVANRVFAGPTTGADADPTFRALVDADIPSTQKVRSIPFIIDGGGSTVTTGVKPAFVVPFACTIVGWDIEGDAAGTCTIDVTTANDAASPSYASIVGAGTKPNVAGPAVCSTMTAPASWTSTAISANQHVRYNVTAVTTFKWIAITLKVTVP